MSDIQEFNAQIVGEDGKELLAGVTVTAFQPEGNEVVEQVQEELESEYGVQEL